MIDTGILLPIVIIIIALFQYRFRKQLLKEQNQNGDSHTTKNFIIRANIAIAAGIVFGIWLIVRLIIYANNWLF